MQLQLKSFTRWWLRLFFQENTLAGNGIRTHDILTRDYLYDLISSSILVAGILEVEAEFTETNAVVISIGTHYAIASRLCVQLHRFQNIAILFCLHKLMAEWL